MRRLRVLHCIPNLLAGGAQQQLAYLAGAQVAGGYDVHVGYVRPGPKLDLVERSGAELHRLKERHNHNPMLLRDVTQFVGRVAPDIVQTSLLQMDILGGLAAQLRSRPWVLAERASAEHWIGEAPVLKAYVRRLVARGVDAIVSNSGAGDSYWAMRARPHVVRRVVPNAIPLDEIQAVRPHPDIRTGLDSKRKVVLYAGRLSPEKNVQNLISALGELANRLPVTSFLCGEGAFEARVRMLVDGLGKENDVRLLGHREDVWEWMKGADVFISVSHAEGHPNAVLEAAACGCPLVLSDIPSHREMFSDAEAMFVERMSVGAIADGLETVLRDSPGTAARTAAARTKVSSLSISRMAEQYDAIYGEVLAKRKRGMP